MTAGSLYALIYITLKTYIGAKGRARPPGAPEISNGRLGDPSLPKT